MLDFVIAFALLSAPVESTSPPAGATPAERGLWLLLNKSYMTRDITQDEFDDLWRTWPEPLRTEAEAHPEKRRSMALERYGLIEMPGRAVPMGYVADNDGWSMNCLSCHGGKVEGKTIPGLGNTHFAFQTLAQDIIKSRQTDGPRRTIANYQSAIFPLGRSNGTTNAQVASVIFTTLRDSDLNLKARSAIRVPKLLHHDLDAPPWWVIKKKKMIYIDGYVEKSHRVIMQFSLVPSFSPDHIKKWDADFKDILAYIESVEAPSYPRDVDRSLADSGRTLFNQNCAECHGTYGEGGEYPEKRIPIDEVGTDRRRLDGMPIEHRQFFKQGWIGEEGQVDVVEDPGGYVAPPLDGIWASAPYFHNGAVPTLWHVLHPDDRPRVWLRTPDGYDHKRMGLEVELFDRLPPDVKEQEDKRRYFDTSLVGKSAAGHDFPNTLSEDEKRAVLEYLKTL